MAKLVADLSGALTRQRECRARQASLEARARAFALADDFEQATFYRRMAGWCEQGALFAQHEIEELRGDILAVGAAVQAEVAVG